MKKLIAFQNKKNQLLKFQKYLLIIVLFFCIHSFSQNKNDIIENNYSSYFNAERETIYLHFNKHTFLLNEAIWFKGYLYDKKSKIPYITTSNVYVSLHDLSGKIIKTNLYYAENGTFSGHFEVDKNIPTGYYFIKAHTNWMKNFIEDESFTSEPIQILNPESINENYEQNETSLFDLQFLPEGGHCISDAINSIGYKIVNCEGQGLMIEGEIINSKKETVNTFKSNSFGVGKFDLLMATGDTYTAKYSINGKTTETQLPISKPIGFSIAVNNYSTKDLTYISLNTNKATLTQEAGKIYYLVIHQNDKSSIINLDIDTLDTKHVLPIENKNLLSGINTITLFNDQLQPLLERQIFNYKENDYLKSNLIVKTIKSDSINVKIDLIDNSQPALSSNLSISVLPEGTNALHFNRNIISTLLIDPYIQGKLEHANYYFDDFDRIKSFHLDLVLLTQGWSKYSWDDIKKGTIELKIPFDKGITIKGTLNESIDPRSSYKVQMFSLLNNIDETTTINEDHTFQFENYFIQDSTKVHFNVYKNGEKIEQPKLYARVFNTDRSSLNQIFNLINTCEIDYKPIDDIVNFSDLYFEGVELDTINLFARKNSKPTKRKNELKYMGNTYSRGIKISQDEERLYPSIVDIISANGFTARNDAGRITIFNRRPVSLSAGQSPLLIIDNINFGSNYDVLTGMRTDEIDEIYFNKNGLGYGSQGGAGVIRIYLKKNLGISSHNSLARYANTLLINGGYAQQKEFYTPLYYDKSTTLFNSYGTIDWKPKLISNSNEIIEFSIKNTDTENLIFIIEGFSVNGKLISEIKKISLTR